MSICGIATMVRDYLVSAQTPTNHSVDCFLILEAGWFGSGADYHALPQKLDHVKILAEFEQANLLH